jgi:hypothetical protein
VTPLPESDRRVVAIFDEKQETERHEAVMCARHQRLHVTGRHPISAAIRIRMTTNTMRSAETFT